MTRIPRDARRRSSKAGFTLIELMIALLVLTVVMVGVLALFDSANQLTVSQLNRVDLQQTLRVAQREMVRTVRLAGRGGLQVASDSAELPQGWAVAIRNNVSGETVINAVGAPAVVDGTDVLTIRGVINTPVYLVEHLDENSFSLDTGTDKGWVTIRDKTPVGGLEQNLKDLQDLLDAGTPDRPEALVLVSAFDDRLIGVVELDHNHPMTADNGTSVTLGFRYAGSTHATKYAELSTDGTNPGVFPELLFERTRVGTVGVLEEYRYYVRQGQQMDNPDEVGLSPLGASVRKLSRARLYPNVEAAYDGRDSNLQVDIAEHVIDFQVALAFDDDEDGLVNETADGVGDDWFGNSTSDVATDPVWVTRLDGPAESLRYLRLSTLARTAQVDRSHIAREIVRVEDHDYPSTDPLNQDQVELRHPRILLRTTVEMRNL